jgi:S-DNA-T family DNA segregation ATPase FtsK/SpoIIIE
MKLKLSLRRASDVTDLVVDADATVTVAELADALVRADPSGAPGLLHPTLAIEGVAQPQVQLEPNLLLAESTVASGQYVQVVEGRSHTATSSVLLSVLSGPDAGATFELSRGPNTVGRDTGCAVRLNDPLVSKQHAKVIVGETVEIVDDNSSNGILVGGDPVQRVELRSGDTVVLGDTTLTVSGGRSEQSGSSGGGGSLAFNRSPRVDPDHEGLELVAPEPPQRPTPSRFPLVTALFPLLMAPILYAVTQQVASMAFVLLSPVMAIGGYWENKRSARAQMAQSTEEFRQNLAELVVELRHAHDAERVGRLAEQPSTAEVVAAVRDLSPLVWTRRPEHARFLTLRLGLGRQPSRTTIEMPRQRNSPVELQQELTSTTTPYLTIDNVPIVAELGSCGSVGVSGTDQVRSAVARGLVAQLVGLHSPAELAVVALASPRSASHWDWLKWLPHVGGDHSPLPGPALATTAPACAALAAALNDLIEVRSGGDDPLGDEAPGPLPAVVVLVENDAPVERSAMVRVMETGREHGVHVIWMAEMTASVPAAARTFLEADEIAGVTTGKVIEAETVHPVVVEQLDVTGAEWLARRLAPVVDAGARADSASDVPTSVSFLSEAGLDLAERPQSVIERWTESNSLISPEAPPRRL